MSEREPVCPLDPHAEAIEVWLLSDHPLVGSPAIMRAATQILMRLTGLAEANAVLAERRSERDRFKTTE